jgi:hypothetical protein
MKKLLLVLLLIVAIGGAVGFYMFNKKVPTLESAQADYSLTANDLFDAYDQDEAAAEQKYANKVIEVSGVVEAAKLNDSIPSLILAAENAMAGGVNCAFSESLEGINPGDSVVVKGRCQGYLMSVILNNCTLIK